MLQFYAACIPQQKTGSLQVLHGAASNWTKTNWSKLKKFDLFNLNTHPATSKLLIPFETQTFGKQTWRKKNGFHRFTFCFELCSINVRPSLEADLLGAEQTNKQMHRCTFTPTVDRQNVLHQLPQTQLCDANVKLYLAKQPFSPKLGVRKKKNKK